MESDGLERKVNPQHTESQIRASLPDVLTAEDKRTNLLNIVGLAGSAGVMGFYQGFAHSRGFPTPGYSLLCSAIPPVLLGAYLSMGEPENSSDIERISESQVRIVRLGNPSAMGRVLAGGAGVGVGGLMTGWGYALGYGLGSLVERLG